MVNENRLELRSGSKLVRLIGIGRLQGYRFLFLTPTYISDSCAVQKPERHNSNLRLMSNSVSTLH